MFTKELSDAYDTLPDEVKSAMLALSIVMDRIRSLSKADRDDLFQLFQDWRNADGPDEQRAIRQAMEEVLAQIPLKIRKMALAQAAMPRGLHEWAVHVGKKIREFREKRGLTQVELAQKTGLPQSHISRLENAEHSATHLTLQKIAAAVDVEVGQIDPCAPDDRERES